jgi:hypothetical protein
MNSPNGSEFRFAFVAPAQRVVAAVRQIGCEQGTNAMVITDLAVPMV